MMLSYCYECGKCMAVSLLKIWINFRKIFLNEFEFDIHSLPYISLSALSFKSIWLKYTRLARPLHYGLEKTKCFTKTFCTSILK